VGVPLGTLACWVLGYRPIPAHVQDMREGRRLPLADRLDEMAHKLLDLVKPAEGIKAGDVKDLLVGVAISVDKAQLLRGQATVITESRGGDDLSHLSDDELKEHIEQLRNTVAGAGDRSGEAVLGGAPDRASAPAPGPPGADPVLN